MAMDATKQADGTREAILVISDSHVGLKAKNHWNSYDMDEFIKRIQRLIAKAIEYCKAHGVYKLKVFLLGDIINGLIHITTRINNQEDVIEQTMKAAEVIAEALTKLSTEIQIVEIFSARGNHDRVTPNKKEEIRSESFMDIIPWYLKARLKPINNIVLFDNEVDDETIITEVCGNLVYSVHGHRDGVESVVADLTLMFDKKPICVIMGHLHHHKETEVHGVEVIVNPSFSGVDDFSVNNRKTAKPAQKLIIFDPVEGRLCTYSIRLDITA
jgi:UDP-2,3-diacylglucosamine pyrophosphatase LpxH